MLERFERTADQPAVAIHFRHELPGMVTTTLAKPPPRSRAARSCRGSKVDQGEDAVQPPVEFSGTTGAAEIG
jgi:hypothetical protein